MDREANPGQSGTGALAGRAGPWVDLALTPPLFLGYHFGVVILNITNASGLVTGAILGLTDGSLPLYLIVTAAAARAMRHALRTIDVFARVGGDEFVALLPDARQEEAAAIANRLRSAVEVTMSQRGHRVTASVGLVTWHCLPDSVDQLIRKADAAMYTAKSAGGNCVRGVTVLANGTATLESAVHVVRSISSGERAHPGRQGS